MALLPPAARLRYPFDLYAKGGAIHALLDQTMICGQSIAAMTRDVGQVRAISDARCVINQWSLVPTPSPLLFPMTDDMAWLPFLSLSLLPLSLSFMPTSRHKLP